MPSRLLAPLTAVLLLATGASVGSAGSAGSAGAAPGVRGTASPTPRPVVYSAPVAPLRIVRGFVAPVSTYGAGHRGVDLATATGTSARAAADGVVRFAGAVAGRGLVVIAHRDGVSTEYEPVRPVVATGTRVLRGQPIGVVRGRHGGCAPGRCLHWGARRGTGYFDPLLLLRPLGRVRLLPWLR